MNDIHSSLRISVFDHEGSGDHKLIGSLVTTVSEIIAVKKFGGGGDSESTNMLDLLDDDNEFVGGISIMQARIVGKTNLKPKLELDDEEEDNEEENGSDEEDLIEKEDDVIEPMEPSFMDYLNSGCELSLCIAIDFTGSNGLCPIFNLIVATCRKFKNICFYFYSIFQAIHELQAPYITYRLMDLLTIINRLYTKLGIFYLILILTNNSLFGMLFIVYFSI